MPEIEPHSKRDNPYLGPRPFDRADAYRFFGREREAEELCSLVIAHRTVLLYSQSGAGKSSLLHAGLIPNLEKRGFEILPTARVSGAMDSEFDPDSNIYVFNCNRCWDDHAAPQATLTNVVSARGRREDVSGTPFPRVAVFDQFEELFTTYPTRWEQREGFFRQLNDMMTVDPTLRVLLVMREDFVARLEPHEEQLPEQIRTRYRLEQLRKETALAAVKKPMDVTGIRFKSNVAEILVDDLLSVSSADAGNIRVQGEFVDPVQLQVTCFSLFRNLPSGTTEISEGDLKAFGNVDQALQEFYRDALRETSSKTGVEEDDLRQWFETKLLTESGTRGLVFRGDKTTGGILNTATDLLDNIHIIRPDVRGKDRWYELSHDRFIQPIIRENDAWRARQMEKAAQQALKEAAAKAAEREREAAQKRELVQAQALALEQKLRADEATAAARRLRRVLFYLGVVIALGFGALSFAFVQQRRARSNEQRAREKEALAASNAVLAQFNAQNSQNALDTLKKSQGAKPVTNPPSIPGLNGSPIKHIIVLMMENRSFDHMLGALKSRDPRIDGLTGNEANLDTANVRVKVQPLAAFQGQLNPDPDHTFVAVAKQLFGFANNDDSAPDMQGFVKSYFQQLNNVNHSHAVMYYFTPDKLPVLATLATEFAICDHWFSSVPGPSAPNRMFAHYGTSFGHVGTNPLLDTGRYESIFERMASESRTSKIYYYDTASTSLDALSLKLNDPQFFGSFSNFLADTASGSLPEYSFVEPNFTDHENDGESVIATDQHPDHNVQAGEFFIAAVYSAIRANPSVWVSSVLVVTYSNHGGLFDHVSPPNAIPDGFEAAADQTGTGKKFIFNRYGVRVPAVIISPYIPKGTVDHTVYDHASIPATVSRLFLKGPQHKSPREQSAHTFDRLLTLTSPRNDAPSFNAN